MHGNVTGPDRLSPAKLLEALGADTFFDESWEKVSVVTSVLPWLPNCIDPTEIERLIASLGTPNANWIQVVRDGSGISSAAITNSEGFVDLQAINAAFRAGYTIQLSKIQIRHFVVAVATRALEGALMDRHIDLARPIGSHLYVTPPNRRGLLPHYDDHNVLVLQLAGSKTWRLYESAARPLSRQSGAVADDALPPLSREVELVAGQVLYVPRGCYHEAYTTAQSSTHLTFDIYTVTLMALLERALSKRTGLGDPVPHGLPVKAAARLAENSIRAAIDCLDVAAALSELRAEVREMLYPLPGGGLDASTAPNLEAVVRHRPGALVRADVNDQGTHLYYSGGQLDGGPEAVAAFEFVARTNEFVVAALPLGSDAAKQAFAQTLIDCGAVELARVDDVTSLASTAV